MPPHEQQAPSLEAYVESHRKAGATDEQIGVQLMQAGWSLQQVNEALTAGVPQPSQPVVNNMTAQTSNAGTPLQIENVQYNMKMKPVQSKVGLYIKVAGTALWFTVVFFCGFLVSLIQKMAGNGGDLGSELIFTLSLTVVTVPIFMVGYRKFLAEQRKNPASIDDIFFKKSIRQGLWGGIVLGAIVTVVALFQLLSAAFLKNGGSFATGFSYLIFALGFAGIVYFYWRLHAKTQR